LDEGRLLVVYVHGMKKVRKPAATGSAKRRTGNLRRPGSSGRTAVPLYKHIAVTLADRVRNHELKPGDMLPSETKLREEFNVSRVTVRQAIMELARTGMVTAHQGKGTFVATPTIAQTFEDRTHTLIEAFSAAGVEPEVAIVSLERIAPPPHVAAILESNDERVVRLCRSYAIDNTVVAVTYLFLTLPMSGVAHILAEPENRKQSSYAIIEQRLGIAIGVARHTIKTVFLDDPGAAVLGMRKGDVCLSMDRVTYSEAGKVLQFMQFYYPPGRMSFEITSSRQGPSIELRVSEHRCTADTASAQ
jgi:GntR family transcriptional regulator